MKQVNLFLAVLALTLFAFSPAAAVADDERDDLEVTMEVLDDASELEDALSEKVIRGELQAAGTVEIRMEDGRLVFEEMEILNSLKD